MILDKFSLKDKIAIVTGATGGLGRSISLALAEAGTDLVLVSRTLSSLKIVAKAIENLDKQALLSKTFWKCSIILFLHGSARGIKRDCMTM